MSSRAPGATAEDPSGFYSGAYRRIVGLMLALGAAGAAGSWAAFGWRVGLGFLAGAAVAVVNFHFLKKVVSAVADAIVEGKRRSGGRVAAHFLLRYFLIAAGAYVIFRISGTSFYGLLYGFLAGLFVPVGAILLEAGYETYMALRRGI